MQRIYLTALISIAVFGAAPASAQKLADSRTSSYYTFIYRITDSEALDLHKNIWNFSNAYLHSLHESFPTDSFYQKKLPIGHYLFVNAKNGNVSAQLRSANNLDLKLLNNERDLMMIFYDSTGEEVSNAEVRIGLKRIRFDKTSKCYRVRKSNNQGIVIVTYQGHSSYFEIERQKNNRFVVRTARKIINSDVVGIIISPFIYVKNNVANLINGGRLYAPPIYHDIRAIVRAKPIDGYITFNKPAYKPGDTLKLKAFLVKKNGKPFAKSATVILRGYGADSRQRKIATLQPYRDGGYKYEFKLVDSLKLSLDRKYSVALIAKKSRHLIQRSFDFENYELKNNIYSLTEKTTHKGTSLFLKGTDSNDMPLFDARAEILLKPVNVDEFYKDKVVIRDTLWFHQLKLETIGETKVVIPDSVLPDVKMKYTPHVSFLNSENERVLKTIDISFDKGRLPILMNLENDSLVITSDEQDIHDAALRLEAQGGSGITSKFIELPFKEKLNNFVSSYWVTRGSRSKVLHVDEEPDQLEILANRTKDSLFIDAENPRKLLFRYFLFLNQQLISRGHGLDLKLKRKSNPNDVYTLQIQYVWGGESQSREFAIPFDKKKLDIKIEHTPVVYPGESASFTISVKDAKGEPVENVDLTAYAVTRKFPSSWETHIPTFSKQRRTVSSFNTFDEKKIDTNVAKSLDYAYWRQRLGLDSLTFYKFLFPDNGYFEERSKSKITQISPFVTGRGIETVVVAYVDGQPVYYRGVEMLQPYSFAIKPGVHTIQLRTKNALLTINNVKIDSAQKLIFSIDRINLPKNCTSLEMPYRFTKEEVAMLRRYFVRFNFDENEPESYLEQEGRFYVRSFRNYYDGDVFAGPFYPGNVNYVEKSGFKFPFSYEPGNSYEFQDKMLKMRSFDPMRILRNEYLGWFSTPEPKLQDEALTKETVEKHLKDNAHVRYPSFTRYPDFYPGSARSGKLSLTYFGKRIDQSLAKATFIVNVDDPDELYIFPTTISEQPFNEGRYQAVVILDDEKYIRADSIIVSAFSTTFYDLKKYEQQERDTFSTNLLELIRKWSAPKKRELIERHQELYKLRSLYYEESSSNNYFTHTVNGRVTDEEGLPIPGVNVLVKGTAIGTSTDLEGYYTLKVPSDGHLIFSFIGYRTEQQPIRNSEVVNATLTADVQQLSEVITVGYGGRKVMRTPRYRHGDYMKGEAIMSSGEAGYLDTDHADSITIALRGTAAGVNNSLAPLVILDGVVVDIDKINRNQVTAITAINGVAATGIYGSRAAGGVLLISTRPGATKAYLMEISKTALPVVMPENNPGNALRKNFRDYAFWQPDLRTDEGGKATFHASFPDDITGWNAYVLGMSTKRRTGQTSSTIKSYKPLVAQIALPNFLIEGDSSIALGKITNYGDDTIQVARTIKVNDKSVMENVVELKNSSLDSITVIGAQVDSISVEYSVALKTYKDGELRKLPVLKKGTLEANGQFLALNSDTTFTIKLPESGAPVKIFAQADLLDVLIDELTFLKTYSYECNEQLASKLKALLLEKEINAYRKTKFTREREVNKIIRKLTDNQKDDGSWGWWKDNKGQVWITLHVVKTLNQAAKAGYTASVDNNKLIEYLEGELFSVPSTATRLDIMNYLSERGQELKVQHFIDSIKSSGNSTVHEKLLAERLSQSMGNKVDWKWLNSMRSGTIKGNYYWGDDRLNVNDNSILNTLLVYQMATREKRDETYIKKIENFFLEARKKNWRNTYESSLILEQLLRELLKRDISKAKPRLQLDGSITNLVESFPFEMSTSSGDLTVTKSGSAPIYFSTYTEKWNTSPVSSNKDFSVKTSFQNDDNKLAAGKPVKLVIDVEVRNDAEYVMIEVPIPAGCSYASKVQSRINSEVHREYHNHRTNIYCQQMKKGKYTFSIDLMPRYSGTYTVNPARVECMYFPTMNGQEGMKQVTIR